MRRLSGVFLAGAILMLPALAQAAQDQAAPAEQAAPAQQQQQAPQELNYQGELVIAAYTINAGSVADYERVLATLKDALMKSTRPEAKQQLQGWRVMRNSQPQQDGSILYLHVIDNVPGADYSITNIVYEVVTDPAEQTAFYELYRGALNQALFVLEGPVAADFSQ